MLSTLVANSLKFCEPTLFFFRLQVRPRGSREPGFPPDAAAPSSFLTPRQQLGGAAFFLSPPHSFTLFIFAKEQKSNYEL